jgi:hypothetical protein
MYPTSPTTIIFACQYGSQQLEHITYRRSLNDTDSLDNFLLVQLCTGTVEIANDCGHAGLVAHGGSEVNWLLWVILWEAISKSIDGIANIQKFLYLLTFPLWRAARFLGKKAREP